MMIAYARSLRIPVLSRLARHSKVQLRALSTESTNTSPTNVDADAFHQAIDAHLENKDSFKNKPLDSIDIICMDGRPFFRVAGQDVGPSLLHLTPFALTGICYFGPKGNFGVERRYTSGVVVINKLEDAQQEITLSNINPVVADRHNELMDEYVDWLKGLQDKVVDHVVENISNYPSLKQKYGFLQRGDDNSMLRDGLMSCTSKVSNTWQGPEGKTIEFVTFKQPVFVKRGKDVPPRIYTEIDKEMEETHNRALVRVFDPSGTEIPIDEAIIRRGDIISCASLITPTVYNVAGNVGITLRKRIRNITRLYQRPPVQRPPSSPYGNISSE